MLLFIAYLRPRTPPNAFLLYAIPPVYDQCVADHHTGSVAAKPYYGACDLFGSAKTACGNLFQHFIERFLLSGRYHLVGHGGLEEARANAIDPNALSGIFQSGTLC